MLAGRFHDGKKAASHAVTVRITPAGLDIMGEDGRPIASWRREDLRPEQIPGAGLRLGSAAAPGCRLVVEDSGPLRLLLGRQDPHAGWLRGGVLAATGVAVLAGLWFALPAGARLLAEAIPAETERRWGGGLADQMEHHWGTCRQPEGEAALAALTNRLAASLPPERRWHKVAVVKLPAENAIALPGGRVLVFQGLLAKAQGPDEVAGVLAHELTHVAERHVAAATIRALGVSALVTIVTGDASGALATGVTLMLAGAYSRADEAAADRGAVDLLQRAGLDTQGLATFFRRVAANDKAPPEWLSSHPDPLARAAAVERAVRPVSTPALTAGQWAALKGICG